MAFEGDLQNIHLADIFQSLSQNRQSGTLIVRSGTAEKRFAFSEHGVAALSRRTLAGSRLGEFLVGRGLITEQELKAALQEQRRTGHALGHVLVQGGTVDSRYVEDVLRYHAAEEIYDVFGWPSGSFQFLEGETTTAPGEASPFAEFNFDPDGIVLEAARRLDEWELVRNAFPSTRDFVARARDLEDGEIENQDVLNLLSLIDGLRDLDAVSREYYLSPFDMYRSLRELLEGNIIRLRSVEELVEDSQRLMEQDDLPRAVAMLERAREMRPSDPLVLELLARACRTSGDTGAASHWLAQMALIREHEGQAAEAASLARDALDCNDGNLTAVEILGRLAMHDGRREEAVEFAGRRVSILRKRREYAAGIQICEETLAVPGCESLELRIHHAACLNASRQPDLALLAFERAARLARDQGRSAELCDIYQSILRIDEGHEAARKFLAERQKGQETRRRRRVQIVSAIALVLILASVGLLTRGEPDNVDARIQEIHGLIRAGQFERAAKAIDRLDEALDDADERTVQISNLRAELGRRSSQAPDRGADAANRLAAVVDPLLEEATEHFEGGRLERAFDRLAAVVTALDGDLAKELRKKSPKLHGKILADDLNLVERRAVQGLEAVATLLHEDRKFVDSLQKQELIHAGQDLEAHHERILGITRRQVDLDAVGAEIEKLAKVTGRPKRLEVVLRSLAEECSHLPATRASAASLGHVIDAQLLRPKVRQQFLRCMTAARDSRDRGRLEASRRTLSSLLDYFRGIEAREPQAPYAAIVSLIRDRGLWKDAETGLREVEAILETLAQARLHLEENGFAEAQRLYVGLLEKHEVIDFREHIRLPLHVTSRPAGAEVRVGDELLGTTPLTLALPYDRRSEIRLSLKTFQDSVLHVAGAGDPGPAVRHIDLDKVPRWVLETGSPVGRCVGFVGSRVVVGGRDGKIHLVDARTGERDEPVRTRLLEGFTAEPVLAGEKAWLIAANGTIRTLTPGPEASTAPVEFTERVRLGVAGPGALVLLITDEGALVALDDGKERWRTPLPGRVLDTPLVTDGRIVVGTTTGAVLAISTSTGKTQWREELGSIVRHAPTRTCDHVLVGQDTGLVVALDPTTGTRAWSRSIQSPVTTRAACHFGVVYIGALDGKIHRLSERNGNPVDRIDVGQPLATDLVIRNGLIYAGTRDGRACAFDLSRGDLLWSFDLGSTPVGRPTIMDDAVVFASRRGRVVAFE